MSAKPTKHPFPWGYFIPAIVVLSFLAGMGFMGFVLWGAP